MTHPTITDARRTSPFRLIAAPEDFRWRGQLASGLPILCERDGAVCEPVMLFLGWSHWNKRAKLSSLKQEAYVLREWWERLDDIGYPWDAATDRTLSDWREAMAAAARRQGHDIEDRRLNYKLAVVFTFYAKAPAAMGVDRSFVSATGPITSHATRPDQWALMPPADRNQTRRGTPRPDIVTAILTHLRNAAKVEGRAEDINDRDWLIARVMAEAGLRRDEVSRLTITMIEDGLRKETVPLPTLVAAVPASAQRLTGLDAIATPQAQGDLLAALDRLEHHRHRENVWITVIGKGRGRGVKREAPFPIGLVRDLLTFGVWGVRRNQIARLTARSKSFSPPPELFLSDTTGQPMTAGAIGNMMKAAFSAVGSDLSGHRLRAYFATQFAARLWHQKYADNGFRWDQTVDNLVLEQVARALGHKEVDTTIRHYLSMAQIEYFGVGTKSKLKELRKAAMDLNRLPKAELTQAMSVIVRLAQQGIDSEFSQALDAILHHPDLMPPEPPAGNGQGRDDRNEASGFRLRIVPRDGDM